jgi:hypothetical protein
MKYTIFLLLATFVFVGGFATVNAQEAMKKDDKMEKPKTSVKFPPLQKSPTDIAYLRDGRNGPVYAKVVYSRPFKNNRVVFGELVPFGKVWRTGADEATEITFYKNVMFGDKAVNAGTYALFTIPGKDSWEIILNSGLHQWGAFTYDAKLDVARTSVKPEMMDESLENFGITFSGGNIVMGWDKTMVTVPIKVQ